MESSHEVGVLEGYGKKRENNPKFERRWDCGDEEGPRLPPWEASPWSPNPLDHARVPPRWPRNPSCLLLSGEISKYSVYLFTWLSLLSSRVCYCFMVTSTCIHLIVLIPCKDQDVRACACTCNRLTTLWDCFYLGLIFISLICSPPRLKAKIGWHVAFSWRRDLRR